MNFVINILVPLKKYLNIITINKLNLFFIIGIIIIFGSHTLYSSGLEHDGALDLLYMILNDSFFFSEKARLFFHFLYQIPAYLFIKFSPSSSLSLLTQVFSFGLIWIHIFSLFVCYIILPENKKNFIFFPLFSFFTGPAIALSISISIALSVYSYVWMTAFIIHYSKLSNKSHQFLFFLTPLPLLFSYELMAYMAYFLIFLCWNKHKKETNSYNKSIITFIIIFLFVTSLFHFYMIFFHEQLTGMKDVVSNVIERVIFFKFLFYPKLNFTLLLSLLILIMPILLVFYKKILIRTLVFIMFISILILFILQIDNLTFTDDTIRFYISLFSLPLGLLFWWMSEKNLLNIETHFIFLISCVLLSFSMVYFRFNSDYHFYKYQKSFSKYLSDYKGIIHKEKLESQFNIKFRDMEVFYQSLIYPKSKFVKAILINSYPECITSCFNHISKKEFCYDYCRKEQLGFPKIIYQLNKSKFFDTSIVLKTITKKDSTL